MVFSNILRQLKRLEVLAHTSRDRYFGVVKVDEKDLKLKSGDLSFQREQSKQYRRRYLSTVSARYIGG